MLSTSLETLIYLHAEQSIVHRPTAASVRMEMAALIAALTWLPDTIITIVTDSQPVQRKVRNSHV